MIHGKIHEGVVFQNLNEKKCFNEEGMIYR